jgi:DNA polymerase V
MPKVEVYSVDEAWLDISGMDRFVNREKKLRELRAQVQFELNIPISIGFSTTKVLAKLANKYAKKTKTTYIKSILTVGDLQDILPKTPVGDLWGIGRRLTAQLEAMGIHTAHELAMLDEYVIRKKLHLPGWHLWRELQGIPTREVTETELNSKTILVSRSFGRDVLDHSLVEAALITFVVKATHKLWAQKRLAGEVTVFVYSNSHKVDLEQYEMTVSTVLDFPTDFPPTLIQAIKKLVANALKPGIAYKKAGIYLTRLVPRDANSIPLFGAEDYVKQQMLRQTMGSLQELENEKPEKGFPLEWATGLAARRQKGWQPLSQYASNLSSDTGISGSKRMSKPWW